MDLDEEQYRIIVESSPNMIWRSGTDTLCNYFNTTWLNFTGKNMDQEIGNGWTLGVHPDDFDECVRIYLDSFNKRESFEMEYRLKRHDDVWRWINDRGVPFFDSNKEFGGYIGSCMDVTEKIEGENLREMAQVDGLTRLKSRQHFEYLARIEFENAVKNDKSLFLIMIDVDKFKSINDNFGHQAGDLVLRHVANALDSNVSDGSILGRFGGDEFLFLISDKSDEDVQHIVEQCKNTINQIEIPYENHIINTSASFGIKKRNDETNLERLIVEADRIMYDNKNYKNSNEKQEVQCSVIMKN